MDSFPLQVLSTLYMQQANNAAPDLSGSKLHACAGVEFLPEKVAAAATHASRWVEPGRPA